MKLNATKTSKMSKGIFSICLIHSSSALSQSVSQDDHYSFIKKVDFTIEQEYERSLADQEDANFSDIYSLTLRAEKKNSDADFVLAEITLEKDLDRDSEVQDRNVLLSYKHLFLNTLPKPYSLSSRVDAYIPTNSDDTYYDSFRGSGGLSSAIGYSFADSSYEALQWFRLSYAIFFNKFLYEYDANRDGGLNNSMSLRNAITLSVKPTESFTVLFYFYNLTTWKTDNERDNDTYSMRQIISYEITKSLTLEVGHKLGDKTHGTNGLSNNINLFDEQRSTVYVNGAFTF